MSDLEELNAALNSYKETLIGVPLTKVDIVVRFIIYSSLMKEYGIDKIPIMAVADRMPIETMEVPHVTSKLVN